MTQHRPPWFPGQFGRRADDRSYSGDPYDPPDDGDDLEPYPAAALQTPVTDPYGDLSAPPDDGGGPAEPAWLPPPGATRPTAAPTDSAEAYAGFYEPGTASREDLKPPRGLRRLLGRRHGKQGKKTRRRRGRRRRTLVAGTVTGTVTGTPPARATPTAADAPPPAPEIVVVPGAQDAVSPGRTARASRRGLVVVAAVTLLLVTGAVLFVVDLVRDAGEPAPTADPTTAPPAAGPPPPTLPPPPIPTAAAPLPGETAVGRTVTDGPFTAEVLAVATGLTELSGATGTATADGEFVVVRLRVTARTAGTFLDIDQRLVDESGGSHEPDPTAPAVVDGNHLYVADLDAGETAEGVVVFDVPPGTVPATFVLRADEDSDGVPVALPTS